MSGHRTVSLFDDGKLPSSVTRAGLRLALDELKRVTSLRSRVFIYVENADSFKGAAVSRVIVFKDRTFAIAFYPTVMRHDVKKMPQVRKYARALAHEVCHVLQIRRGVDPDRVGDGVYEDEALAFEGVYGPIAEKVLRGSK